MRVRVLGSAAGGGFPQWNCGCDNCREVRRGSPRLRARTEESIVVSADSRSWFLVNASPDVRRQFESFPALEPGTRRGCPVDGIVLTNGDLDHCLGLLTLRESEPLAIYATSRVREGFKQDNVLYRTLERFPDQVTWHELPLGRAVSLASRDGTGSGLSLEAVAVPGKLPIHLETKVAPSAEDNVGLRIREESTGRTLAYLPAVAGPSSEIDDLTAADCIFFDGTFWSDDELSRQGLGTKRARDMAHWPVGGDEGSLKLLERMSGRRRVLIHINNTNPMLAEDSAEASAVRAAGVEIAYDGMEVDI
jgi:pyrroloquinoline quinone biosynthesis protein B